jgi:hypothetical protein
MKNYKLFAFTNEEKEAIYEKAQSFGLDWALSMAKLDGKFVYIDMANKKACEGFGYRSFEMSACEYISVHDFLALPEPKKEFPFKVGDKVISRDNIDDLWKFDLFSHIITTKDYPFRTIGEHWSMIAPLEGNEDKPGTTDDAVGVWTAEDIKELYGTKRGD